MTFMRMTNMTLFGIISNKVPIFKRMYIFNIKNFFSKYYKFLEYISIYYVIY